MSLPATLKEERFFALPKVTHQKVLGDDYVHLNNTVETIKIKSVSSTGSIVNYKTTFHLDQQDSKNNIQQLDELKLSFPYKSLHFQAKMDRKGNIKKHVEIGEYKNVFFYTQFKHNFSYQNLWARLGAFYFDKGNQVAVRLERDAAG
jgi:hypothetical protein